MIVAILERLAEHGEDIAKLQAASEAPVDVAGLVSLKGAAFDSAIIRRQCAAFARAAKFRACVAAADGLFELDALKAKAAIVEVIPHSKRRTGRA